MGCSIFSIISNSKINKPLNCLNLKSRFYWSFVTLYRQPHKGYLQMELNSFWALMTLAQEDIVNVTHSEGFISILMLIKITLSELWITCLWAQFFSCLESKFQYWNSLKLYLKNYSDNSFDLIPVTSLKFTMFSRLNYEKFFNN